MTTNTLTTKLHQRADEKLQEEINNLIAPIRRRTRRTKKEVEFRAVLEEIAEAIFVAEQDASRELEVNTFLSAVEQTKEQLDSILQ